MANPEEIRKALNEANQALREIAGLTRQAREYGNTLSELEALRRLEPIYSCKSEIQRAILAGELAVLSARIGNIRDATRYGDFGMPEQPSLSTYEKLKVFEGYQRCNAVEALAELAVTARVIMINEAHHVPQHRAFTLLLVEALRSKGFDYFAAETLFETDLGLHQRGYPITTSGAYISEPVYGEMVRTALRVGYQVIPYEAAANGDADARERGQAQNLYDRILKIDPKAKILVHAGYSHINKSGTLAGATPMAVRFKEISGVDPFTVDQVTMTEHSSPEYEHPLFRLTTTKGWIQEPTLFRSRSRLWSAEPNLHDATLFHPPSEILAGRPNWLRLGGGRKEFPIEPELIKSGQSLLVQVRHRGEPKDAIPVDQLEIQPREPLPVLLLPNGDFEVHVASENHLFQTEFAIEVPF